MMKKAVIISILTTLCILPAIASAQVDKFGKTDTLYVDVERINPSHYAMTISYSNDQPVAGLSIPLQMTGGKTPIVADSAVYTGGRVDAFAFKGFRPDTAIQCVTLGMIADLTGTKKILEPGNGRLVTVFVSSLDDSQPIEKFLVDTTTTHPDNSLMIIADRSLLGPADSTLAERMKNLEIVPALVIREPK